MDYSSESTKDQNIPSTPPPTYEEKQFTYSNPGFNQGQPATVPHTVVVCQPVPVGSPTSGPGCTADYKAKYSYGVACILGLCGAVILGMTIPGYVFQTYQISVAFQTAGWAGVSGFMAFLAGRSKRNGVIIALFAFVLVAVFTGVALFITGILTIVRLADFDEESEMKKPKEDRVSYSQRDADISVPLLGVLIAAVPIVWIAGILVLYITCPTVNKVCKKGRSRGTCGPVVSAPNTAQQQHM